MQTNSSLNLKIRCKVEVFVLNQSVNSVNKMVALKKLKAHNFTENIMKKTLKSGTDSINEEMNNFNWVHPIIDLTSETAKQ